MKLDDSTVHATIFQQDKPKDALNSIYFVFERINSGGISLSPQEIRNCVNSGSLLDLVRKLNANADWRAIFGPENARLKDQELILRFLALYSNYGSYNRPMAGFLNRFASENANPPDDQLNTFGDVFGRTIDLVRRSLGEKAFRSIRALNAAVFDSVMVGLATRLAAKPQPPSLSDVAAAYQSLLADSEYRRACERSTADEENVAKRIRLATEAFATL